MLHGLHEVALRLRVCFTASRLLYGLTPIFTRHTTPTRDGVVLIFRRRSQLVFVVELQILRRIYFNYCLLKNKNVTNYSSKEKSTKMSTKSLFGV